jgi:two-component system, cell cycle sensor histidine kinase and response regulator CckA
VKEGLKQFGLRPNDLTGLGDQGFSQASLTGEIKGVRLRLEEAESRYQNLFKATPMGIHTYALEPDGSLIFTGSNPAADTILGLDHQPLRGWPIEKAFPALMETEVPGHYRRLCREGGSWHSERCAYTDERVESAFEVHAFQTGSGTMAAMFLDVTERKRLELERQQLEAQLRQAQKMEAIGTLAGGIAHDFNNILAGIMGYSELALIAVREGQENARELEEVLHLAKRARDLVKKIMTFGRKLELDLKPLQLNHEILQARELLSRTIPKMIAFDVQLDDDLKPIQGDAGQIEQVLINLATNAADAMPNGGTVTIRTRNVSLDEQYCRHQVGLKPGAYVWLLFSDTGSGIPPEVLPHIFDPFFTTKEVGKGTGLGLSTIYGIVQGHGGHLTCFSEPDVGTTFNLYWPVSNPVTVSRPGEALIPDRVPARRETILLVDDEEVLRDVGRQILTREGYQVVTAKDGEEALLLYQQHNESINLVVMDLSMPGMGGRLCLKELLALNPQLKAIIVTGYLPDEQLEEIIGAGARGYMPKPFRRGELLRLVREVLDH